MVSNNIIIIILVIAIIGAVVYFYYNQQPFIPQPKQPKQPKKKVRFNHKVKRNIYSQNSSCSEKPHKLIDIDQIIKERSESPADEEQSPCKKINATVIYPSNLDRTNPEDTWDASFGFPLMSKEEKKNYFDKLQQNNKKYEKALGTFAKYQTDRSTIIQTETTIDPFKPDHRSGTLKGRAIKDIYDEQVAGPKAKPKKINKKTSFMTTYENESELNGGSIPGTSLFGFDDINDAYKTAAFGNEF